MLAGALGLSLSLAASGAFAAAPTIPPGVYSGVIDLQAADSLGPRFSIVSGSARGGGKGTIQLSATDTAVKGTFNWDTSFTAQTAARDATGQGVLQVTSNGTLAGAPDAVAFDGTSATNGTIHVNVSGMSFDQPVSVSDQIPGSGSKVQILAANCAEIDGSFAPPLAQAAAGNGLIVQSLTAQFAAFRNADRLPGPLLDQITDLNQRALAFKPVAGSLSAPDFLQQVWMLIHSANLVYSHIYDVIGDAGCAASGTWGSFLLPTVQVLFGFCLGPGTLNADQLHSLVALGYESGYLSPEAVAAALPDLNATIGDTSNDPHARLVLYLWTLHEDLEDQAQQATNAAGAPDVSALREVYLTAQMIGFDDILQQVEAYQ